MKNFPIIRSRRLRSTPYTERIEAHGVSGYTVYNHMLLPVSFKSIEDDYNHLKKNSKIEILNECGHMIMFEKAFEMREKVFEFLKK